MNLDNFWLRQLIVLHSHSSGLLIHRSGYSRVCSDIKMEMEFREVKIRVWMLCYPYAQAGIFPTQKKHEGSE